MVILEKVYGLVFQFVDPLEGTETLVKTGHALILAQVFQFVDPLEGTETAFMEVLGAIWNAGFSNLSTRLRVLKRRGCGRASRLCNGFPICRPA